jgi:protocatechuate 3,4-dioxygenase beta subunit
MPMPAINAVFSPWQGPTTLAPAMNSVWWSLLEGGSEEAVGTLSGFIYRDENANGRRDPSEEGVFGVPTYLTGISFRSGGVARVAFTDRAGYYRFTDLEAGRYVIHGNQPDAYLSGEDMVGFVDGTQTGYLGGNKTIGGIFLPPGGLGLDYNFGQHMPATLEGVVVEDGMEGVFLEGVVVSLTGRDYRGMLVRETALTAPDGTYRFERLRPGTYQISAGKAPKLLNHRATVGSLGGWHEGRSEVVSIEVADGAFGGQYNFGQVAPAHLSGTVRLAGAKTPTGVSGVLVTLTGSDDDGQAVKRTVFTANDGRYEFADLLPGRYSVSANLKSGEALPGSVLGRKPGGIIGAAGQPEKVIRPASAEITGLTVSEISLGADDMATDFNFVGTPAGEPGSK